MALHQGCLKPDQSMGSYSSNRVIYNPILSWLTVSGTGLIYSHISGKVFLGYKFFPMIVPPKDMESSLITPIVAIRSTSALTAPIASSPTTPKIFFMNFRSPFSSLRLWDSLHMDVFNPQFDAPFFQGQ